MITCGVISIGDELLIGQVLNTNVNFIDEHLSRLGVEVQQNLTIGDDEKEILEALKSYWNRYDITVVTGGLGPTNDDITKHCACTFFDSKLVEDKMTLERIYAMFDNTGYVLNDKNIAQALVPDKCKVLINNYGTAPGMMFDEVVDNRHKVMAFFPGVPLEMMGIFNEYFIDEIKNIFDKSGIYYRTVMTQGIGESFVAEKIKSWEDALPQHVKLAYLPKYGSVKLRLTAYGDDFAQNKSFVDKKIAELSSLIPDIIYGYDDITLQEAVGNILKQRHLTLSTAESCTGGNIAHQITLVPGSSQYFKGAMVCYVNEIKENLLSVRKSTIDDHGVVSKEVAEEMAENALRKFNTDIAVATTGVVGPSTIDDNKVGTVWIAVADKQHVVSKSLLLRNNREVNISKSTDNALMLVYKFLFNEKNFLR